MQRALERISPEMEQLLVVRVHKINEVMAPGLYLHDWYSSLFDKWIQSCVDEIRSFEEVLENAQNVLEFRIEPMLRGMSEVKFIRLPEQPRVHPYEVTGRGNAQLPPPPMTSSNAYVQSRREPGIGWTINELVYSSVNQSGFASNLLQQLSQSVYEAADEYATTILADFDEFVTRFIETYTDEEDKSSGTKYG